jgi:hypothetical protein
MAFETVSTPEPTIPTTIEVVVEELWIRLVASIPMNKPTKGLEVVFIRFSAKPLPKPLNAEPIRPMLTRKKYRKSTTKNIFIRVLNLFFIRPLRYSL